MLLKDFLYRITFIPFIIWYVLSLREDTTARPCRFSNCLLGESEKLLLINGSADLVGLLAAHDLIDEYLLTVAPLVVGKGKRLFPEGFEARLRLVEYKAYKTGMLRLHYETVKR